MSSTRPKITVTCNSACVSRALLGLEEMNMGDTEKENVVHCILLFGFVCLFCRDLGCACEHQAVLFPQTSGKLTSPPSGGNR